MSTHLCLCDGKLGDVSNLLALYPHEDSVIYFVLSHLASTFSRGLGGQLGQAVQEQLSISNVGELLAFSLNELQQKFGDKAG